MYLVFFFFSLVFGVATILWGAVTGNVWMVVWATVAVVFALNGIRHERTA